MVLTSSRMATLLTQTSSTMTSTQLHRRNFLSLTGKGLGLAALSSSSVGALLKNIQAATRTVAHLTPEQAAMDEDFWFEIQKAFTVTRGIINLNVAIAKKLPSRATLPSRWRLCSSAWT